MINPDTLNSLRRLDTDGHLALSLYLDVSSAERRRGVMQRISRALEPLLAPDGPLDAEQAQGLREDLEMLRLYFGTSASKRHPYVAIFSCAAQLFWRVVPLEAPVEETIRVGECLEWRPLSEAISATVRAPSRKTDLLPHFNCASV